MITSQSKLKPTILFLGVHHMDNPERDIVNAYQDDVLQAKRQSEIELCLSKLQAFNPTKIAVEIYAREQESLSKKYRLYCDGSYSLGRGESEQLGFRLARMCGLHDIYAVDWNDEETDNSFLSFAQQHQPHIYDEIMHFSTSLQTTLNSIIENSSIVEILKYLNSDDFLIPNQAIYLKIAQIGSNDTRPGVDYTTDWYKRNLIILSNLIRLLTTPNERLLVLYGAGHISLLTEFAKASGMCHVENVHMYLS